MRPESGFWRWPPILKWIGAQAPIAKGAGYLCACEQGALRRQEADAHGRPDDRVGGTAVDKAGLDDRQRVEQADDALHHRRRPDPNVGLAGPDVDYAHGAGTFSVDGRGTSQMSCASARIPVWWWGSATSVTSSCRVEIRPAIAGNEKVNDLFFGMCRPPV